MHSKIHTLAISGYRSIRDLVLPLDQLTVITGANGSGKSSLYRSIRLLADVAQGRAVSALAHEGGLQSTLWAGPERISRAMKTENVPVQGSVRRDRVSLKLGFASDDYGYAIDLGYPPRMGKTLFNLDPEIKTEVLWVGEYLKRTNELARRSGRSVQILSESGNRRLAMEHISTHDSMMTHVAEPKDGAELLALRERMRGWRFYDQFRTDGDASARAPRIGTHTPVLDADGADFAAALQTIREIGDVEALDMTIDEAFPNSRVEILENDGRFEVVMRQHGLLRPLRTAELSDGTLRYLLLATALLSPRPPSLLVLNEPENSLHPSLLEPLARLIRHAAQSAQIIVVSHADALVSKLETAQHCLRYNLFKEFGETRIEDAAYTKWQWPKR